MLEKKVVSQCISSDYCRGWNDAVDAMPRWISVKDRLPERGTWVLCCGAKGGMFLSDWVTPPFDDEETAYCSVPNARCGRNAKYWMPLPEPPKEVQP